MGNNAGLCLGPEYCGAARFKKSSHPVDGRLAEGNEPFLATLADDSQHALEQVHLPRAQTYQLRYPQSRCVEHLQHRAVPNPECGFEVGCGEQSLDLLLRQDAGQRAPESRGIDPIAWIILDSPFALQMPVELT